jgi:hypothetical protein
MSYYRRGLSPEVGTAAKLELTHLLSIYNYSAFVSFLQTEISRDKIHLCSVFVNRPQSIRKTTNFKRSSTRILVTQS